MVEMLEYSFLQAAKAPSQRDFTLLKFQANHNKKDT